MPLSDVHTCHCSYCQQETLHPDQELHRQMNLLLSRLDEQQPRWYVAVESNRIGPGGDRWRMVSPNDKWFNRTEYRLHTRLVRVKEQNDTHFLLWILSHP